MSPYIALGLLIVVLQCWTPCVSGQVSLSLGGIPLNNNSVVVITAIGEYSDGGSPLICNTTFRPCCETHGEWYYPNDTVVPNDGTGNSFYPDRRDDGTVRLHRRNNGTSPTGTYYCEIPLSNATDIQRLTVVVIELPTAEKPSGPIAIIFRGVSLPNNSVLSINDVGEFSNGGAIFCTTDRRPCCRSYVNRFGEWYYPDGRAVPNIGTGEDFYRGRLDNGTIHLNRRNNTQSPTGSFYCELPDSSAVMQRVCVTLVDVSLTPSGIPNAGAPYQLNCTATGSTLTPTFTWLGPPGNTPLPSDTRMVSGVMSSGSTYTSILQFDPIQSSHEGMYTCQVTVGNVTELTSTQVSVEEPVITAMVSASGTPTVGQSYSLTCTVTGADRLNPTITYHWFKDNTVVSGETQSTLSFSSLSLSDAGQYRSDVTVSSAFLSQDITAMSNTQDLTLQVPPPTAVTVTASTNGTILTGSSLTLTCTIELSEAVDIAVTVNTVWSGPSGTQFTTTTSVATRMTDTTYISTATLSSVRSSYSGEYTCTATVSSTSSFVTDSEATPGTTTVDVELQAPSSPTIASATPQSTSITITWSQPEGDVVDGYQIISSYQGPCPGVHPASILTTISNGAMRDFTVSDLHEFGTYTVTVIAVNSVGIGHAITSVSTLEAVPSGPPQSLTVTSTTPFIISIQWGEVECLEQNSVITGYSVRYGGVTASVIGASNRTFTASGLTPRTSYTFEVAAVSDSGTGPSVIDTMATDISESVGLLLNSQLYPNNSIVDLDEIGEDSDALFCLTNKTDCCRKSDTGTVGVGVWFFPNGNTVDTINSDDGIYRNRGPSMVRLNRRHNAQTTGVFSCDIPDASGASHTLYVGVYPVGSGSPSITGLLYNRTNLTLTCTSTGGPAINVTWRRNGAIVEVDNSNFQQSQSILDTSTATYENTLSSGDISNFVGRISCSVSNSRGSDERSLALAGITILTSGPFIVGISATLTCTSDSPAIVIEWLDNAGRVVASVGSMDHLELTFNPVNDSIHNSRYTCRVTRGNEMVAQQNITANVTVPPMAIMTTVSASGSPIAGQSYSLTCSVSKTISGLVNTPVATWTGNRTGVSISTSPTDTSVLTFDPLRTSNAGRLYTCSGSLSSPALSVPQTMTVDRRIVAESPPPTAVTVTASPDGTIFTGSSLTLTCTIELSEAVDIAVTVNTVWSGPSGTQFITNISVATRMTDTTYTSTATLSSVETSDSGEYTCTATVSSTSSFVTDSEATPGTTTVYIIPVITAVVSASGTPTVGQSYSLTCTVTGADRLNPTITYQWFKDSTVVSGETQSTLSFSSLSLSDAGQYRCNATVGSTNISQDITAMSNAQDLTLQIPPPTAVTVTASPDGTIFTGSSLTLTCTIELSEAVDIAVTVNTVWSGPSGTQFTTTNSVATRMADTTYTSTAILSSVRWLQDSGEFKCRVTVSSTSPFVTSSTAIGATGVRDVLQKFQLKLGRTDDCITWNSNKAKEVRSYILEELLLSLASRCQCDLPRENLLNGVFSCQSSHNQTTYRSTIIGTQSHNATELVGLIQDWVTSAPTVTIQWYTVRVDPKCPVSISSLGDPECRKN